MDGQLSMKPRVIPKRVKTWLMRGLLKGKGCAAMGSGRNPSRFNKTVDRGPSSPHTRCAGGDRRTWGDEMTKLSALTTIACLAVLAAGCSKPAPVAPANDTAAATPAPAAAVTPATATPPAAADAIVGKWVDDENDTYTFAADGAVTSANHASLAGTWKPDGEARYDLDLTLPEGVTKGLACVDGDTMAAHIGGDELDYLGRVGADGQPAKPDTTLKCE